MSVENMTKHLELSYEDPIFPSLAVLLESQEEHCQEIYGADFRANDDTFNQLIVRDNAAMAMISMVCAIHEAMDIAKKLHPELMDIKLFKDAHDMGDAVYVVTSQGWPKE